MHFDDVLPDVTLLAAQLSAQLTPEPASVPTWRGPSVVQQTIAGTRSAKIKKGSIYLFPKTQNEVVSNFWLSKNGVIERQDLISVKWLSLKLTSWPPWALSCWWPWVVVWTGLVAMDRWWLFREWQSPQPHSLHPFRHPGRRQPSRRHRVHHSYAGWEGTINWNFEYWKVKSELYLTCWELRNGTEKARRVSALRQVLIHNVTTGGQRGGQKSAPPLWIGLDTSPPIFVPGQIFHKNAM